MHTDTQTHSAAATHTATLHTQRARHKGSNTRRQRGSAHPPTTASSSVQRSHSRGHTQHLQHGVTVAAGSYTTAVRHCDCVALRLRHARSQDTCRTSAQHGLPAIAAAATLNTRATPLPHCNAAVTHACIQCSGTHAHTQSARNNRKQRCAVTRQPQRDAVQRRTRDNTQHPTHCARDSAGNARRMTQPRCSHFRRLNAHLKHTSTSAALPATITPQTRAHRHTRCDKPRPAQRHVSVMARAAQHSARL
jgi:hypothetical protein